MTSEESLRQAAAVLDDAANNGRPLLYRVADALLAAAGGAPPPVRVRVEDAARLAEIKTFQASLLTEGSEHTSLTLNLCENVGWLLDYAAFLQGLLADAAGEPGGAYARGVAEGEAERGRLRAALYRLRNRLGDVPWLTEQDEELTAATQQAIEALKGE